MLPVPTFRTRCSPHQTGSATGHVIKNTSGLGCYEVARPAIHCRRIQLRRKGHVAQAGSSNADSHNTADSRHPPDSNENAAHPVGPSHHAEAQTQPSTGPLYASDPPQHSRRRPHNNHLGDPRYDGDGSLRSLLATVPLRLAALAGRTNDHYLEKRRHRRWWRSKSSQWPKVPGNTLAEQHLPEPAMQLWAKLLPLALIFFCSTFNLTVLQTLKDSIVVTAAGAEALPYLASFCVLPATLAFFWFYNKIVEQVSPRAVFMVAMLPLIAFYALFAWVLYPAHASLHYNGLFESLAPKIPTGLHGLIKVVECWTFSAFFAVAELWGAVVISLLFWSHANNVCSVDEAKTIYPLVGVAANLALVVAGNYTKAVNNMAAGSMLSALRFMVGGVMALTGVMWAAKAFMDVKFAGSEGSSAAKPKKKTSTGKGSIGDAITTVKGSKKILCLAVLVMAYGLSHRVFDVAWKSQLRTVYPTAQAYQGVLANVSIATGWLTMGLMLTGRFVFQYLGWSVAALATPFVMFVSGAAFFGLSLAAKYGWTVPGLAPPDLALIGVTAGIVTQVFARSSKFSLFDPAKEMVYIELDKEEKSRGKAAVDLLGSQIGKSGASWLTQALLLGLGSISAAQPVLAAVYVAVIVLWMRAVGQLKEEIDAHERKVAAEKLERKAREAAVADGHLGRHPAAPHDAHLAANAAVRMPVPPNMSVSDSYEQLRVLDPPREAFQRPLNGHLSGHLSLDASNGASAIAAVHVDSNGDHCVQQQGLEPLPVSDQQITATGAA